MSRSLEESGQYEAAASKYLEFANEFSKSQYVDDALNNAAVSYRKGKNIPKSVGVFKRLIKQFPNSKFVKGATLAIGKGYEDLAMFASAATYYEAYQKRYPTSKSSADLIYNAGIFRENLGENNKAIADYKIYTSRYKKEKDVPVVEFATGDLYAKAGKTTLAINHFRGLETKYQNSPDLYLTAIAKRGLLYQKTKQTSRAQAVFRKVVSEYARFRKRGVSPDTLALVAESHHRSVAPKLRRFKAVKLNVGLAKFESNIKTKTTLLDGLIKEYQTIVDYGAQDWVPAAIYSLGQAYDDFASSLDAVKAPANLDPEVRVSF